MLDLRRLRLLHELHRRGTVGAVAEALSYSPSTVSQQLRVLEREAGTALFEPAGRRVRLTDAALVLTAHAEQLLAGVERAEADLAAAAAGAVAGVVRVGSFQTASLHLLLPAMDALRRTHPGVEVRLVEAEPEPALEALPLARARPRAGRRVGRDAARAAAGDRPRGPVRRAGAARPPGRPPRRRRRPGSRSRELAGETWATGYAGGGMEALVRRVCATHGGFEPIVRHQTNELSMLRRASSPRGHAVTLLPEIAFAGGHEGVAVRPVAGARRPTAPCSRRRGPAPTAVRRWPPSAPRCATLPALRPGSPSSRSGPSGSS